MNDNWSRLDNAARIFPAARSKNDTQVFRFSCVLNENINEETLQKATEEVLEEFPMFRCVLRRGFFWYYLEESDIVPVVREEYKMPCDQIYQTDMHTLLFEVTYYKKRINFEVFHVLCDGTGAMDFLRALIGKYLSLAHGIKSSAAYRVSTNEMNSDSFLKYYSGDKTNIKSPKKRAYKIIGKNFIGERLKVISGNIDVKKTLEQAHRFNTTVTVFLAAVLIKAIGDEISERAKKYPVRLLIPINLRNFFPSDTARNFFCLAYIGYNFQTGDGTFEDIIKTLQKQLSTNLTSEIMLENINSYASVAENKLIKLAPLFLKDIVLKQAYRMNGTMCTGTFSNVGIVKMPEELERYIDYFEIYISTDRLQLCTCSFKNKLNLSFTSHFINSDTERRFFKYLIDYGIDVELHSNMEVIGD